MIKVNKILPFLLSAVWIFMALWIELAPNTMGFITSSLKGAFTSLAYLNYDMKIRARSRVLPPPPKSIVIVAIDDRSIQLEGRWPWPYSVIGNLIIKLREQGVSVIALDILLSKPESNIISLIEDKLPNKNSAFFYELDKLKSQFDENAQLVLQIQDKHDIVLPFLFYDQPSQGILPNTTLSLNLYDLNNIGITQMAGYMTNFPLLQRASSHNGFISRRTDDDGVLRGKSLVLRYQDKIYPSLALAAAQILFKTDDVKLNIVDIAGLKFLDSVQLGKLRIPTDKTGRVMIPFHGKSHSFKYYSATDILNNKIKLEELKDTVVFMGLTAGDFSNYSSFSNTPVDTAMPNVEVQANILSGIMENNFPYSPYWAKAATIGLVLTIGLFLAILLPILTPVLSIALAIFALLLIYSINIWIWASASIGMSFATPTIMIFMLIITNMTYRFLFESRKKKFLCEAFGHYLAPEYVKILLDHPDAYTLEGEAVELTVLFADIRNFTTITESLDAVNIKKLLNKFFSPMTEIILNHGGTIDKYVGDMIMAFWGAPIKNIRHREAAIEAALDMLAKAEELKDDFLAAGFPEINIGIGINSGVMNVGDMGSEFRRAYTVLGDPVNVASRLEGSTKYYGVKLLVGAATRADQTKFVFRLIDRVKVKGKQVAIDVYEVICRMVDASPELLKEIKAHEEAMNAYFLADFALARTLFTSLEKHHPDAYIYKLFLERINYYEKNPPGDEWDGAYERTDK